MEELFGLIGHPVEHSISPLMHNAAFEHLKVSGHYMGFDILPENLKESLLALKLLNFKGFNVTIPHKTSVMNHLDDIDEKAFEIGAVNTVVNHQGKWVGYNTDWQGFILSLKTEGLSLKNKKVCVFGHGGAAKAIVYACINEPVKSLEIFSRRLEKVDSWFRALADKHAFVELKSYDHYEEKNNYDLMINTTPLGMFPETNISIVDTALAGHDHTIFFDLIYNPSETLFLKGGRESGRKTINGLDMLIYQGIGALKLWLPDIEVNRHWTRDDVLKHLKHLV